jgi:ArsR family transcriptional regulator
MDNIEQQAATFSALADPTRLKILGLLGSRKEPDALCVGALTMLLGISQPAVSQHLRILKSAGLVKAEKRGYHVHYSIDLEAVKQCQELVAGLPSLRKSTVVDPCSNCDQGKIRRP